MSPSDAPPGTVVHDEVVPARAPWTHLLARGETLRIVDRAYLLHQGNCLLMI